MLLGLLLAISLGNIAVAFYTTRLFRRDVLLRQQQRQLRSTDASGDELPDESDESPMASATAEPATKVVAPKIDPKQSHPVEDLYFSATRLGEFLAEIDHSVVSGQAGEDSTEEKLSRMWPQLAAKTEPLAVLLSKTASFFDRESAEPNQAGQTEALQATGNTILQQCRDLSEEMETPEKRLSNAESGMHHLRDLFNLACTFRDQCEDVMIEVLGIDLPASDFGGRLAFQELAAELLTNDGDALICAVGLEVDHLGELNGMYGATIVNALLDELPGLIAAGLPDHKTICRYHSQYYLLLIEGDTESVATATDVLRQQIEETTFRGDGREVEITISGTVAPLSNDLDKLIQDLLAAMKSTKQGGTNRIVCHEADAMKALPAVAREIEKSEIVLKL